jgi:hypothetical protein
MRFIIIIAALGVTYGLEPRHANADIIIDDFDDPVTVVSPEMKNEKVTTLNVGPLNARRDLGVLSAAADADAHIDISSSTMEIHVGNLRPNNLPVRPVVAAQLQYQFEQVDLTSGNAFFIDFKSVNGSIAPEFVRLLIFDDQGGLSYFDTYSPIPFGGPFSAVLPFDEFVLRGGGAWPVHFNSVREIWMELRAKRNLQDFANHSWTAEIDRIRVGIVPEPDGVLSFLLALLWRRRRGCCVV